MGGFESSQVLQHLDTNKDNQIILYELKSGVEKMDSSTQSLLIEELEKPEIKELLFSSLKEPLSQAIGEILNGKSGLDENRQSIL